MQNKESIAQNYTTNSDTHPTWLAIQALSGFIYGETLKSTYKLIDIIKQNKKTIIVGFSLLSSIIIIEKSISTISTAMDK